MLLVAGFIFSLMPIFSSEAKAQTPRLRTVWENPYTLTTYHTDNEVNSTFYTFPKVIWNGSQYVDYLFNSSEMSAGIGSVYIKVWPDHTVFYDPYQTEERIKAEAWMVEHYNASNSIWETEKPIDESVHSLVNSSGIYFDRTTTLDSGGSLDEWYWLGIGSEMKISVMFNPVESGEYRMIWLLSDVCATKARWLETNESVTSQLVVDKSCLGVQFASENESKCLVDWSDALLFNKENHKSETCFQQLSLQRAACENQSQARVVFGDFSLNSGESLVLDPTIMTLCTNANSGLIEKYGATYPPYYGTLVVPNYYTTLGVGQFAVLGPYYYTQRSYFSFDTSLVPAMAYNMNVTLMLKTSQDFSTVDFTMEVMGGNQPICENNLTILSGTQPIYGDSLSGGSWGTGTVMAATWDTANYPGNGVYINLTIPSNQINKIGSTQFELKSSRDGTNPPQANYDEVVYFYSGLSSGNEPELEVSYCLDTVTVNGETWLYRNASASSVTIVFFGGMFLTNTSIWIRSIDFTGEKELGKIMFLDVLVANGFSIYTPANSAGYSYESYYQNDSTWIRDLTVWLMDTQDYSHVYLFGFSGGGTVVGNEIQKDYASRFSAAVMNCAPVDWQNNYDTNLTGQMWHTALTASKAKVTTSFPENVEDYQFYTQEKKYYDNAIVDKEWHNWTGGHGAFFRANQTCMDPPYENDSVAVINWFKAAHPPTAPFTPTGVQTCNQSSSYNYSSGTVDPNGENVSYLFSWGDGTSNSTTGHYYSGTNATCSHTWGSTGSFNVTVRAKDASQRWSCWSPPLTVNVNGQGGGGGCPYLYDWNGSDFVKDNNLLPASENGNGTDTKDYYLFQQPLVPVFSTKQASLYSLQISEFESNIDYIDQVKLTVVDHAQGTNIAVTPEGRILTYTSPATPISCIDSNGVSHLSEIDRMDGNVSDPPTYFQGNKGNWLVLNFGRVTGPYANLILRDDQKCADVCINVQVPDQSGGWNTVEVLHPRDFWSIEAVNMTNYLPTSGDFIVRLLWTASHRLDFVGLDTSSPAQVQTYSASPKLAIHSTMGIVTSQLLYDDENCVELINGQQITIAFTLPNQARGTTRDFICYTDGYYYTIT